MQLITFLCVSPWLILAPIIVAQYIYATIGLVVLAKRETPTKNYVIWNIVILVVFFVGCTVFLIYNAAKPKPKE